MRFRTLIPRQIGLLLSTILLTVASFALSADPATAATYEVKMGADTGQTAFVPETVNIKPGDTVKWVMNKIPPHNVVFEGDKVPQGNKALAKEFSHQQFAYAPGDSFKTTFPEDAPAGVYPYYCTPHRGAGMTGEVIVED